MADPYCPTAPTYIARRFNEERQIPEERVRAMFEQILSDPIAAQVGKLIAARLGRPLESFDIWYNGFRGNSAFVESDLDQMVRKKYPTGAAFEADLPNIFKKLGFSEEKALFLAARIAVDPARGSGHAMGAAMRTAKARLRTRVPKDGMDFKGFNIAMHELGHNVEQTFSLYRMDHYLLNGVPNNAFTEAIAFVFQAEDMNILGLAKPTPESEALLTIHDYWQTFEIARVGLLDMGIWHWMYEHPNATPQQLQEAVLSIAKEIWNRFYAPILGTKDSTLLAVYSHLLNNFLYLPDYPIGHCIAAQISERIAQSGSIGPEVERMATIGNIAPDLWMQQATGKPVGPESLLRAAAKALEKIK